MLAFGLTDDDRLAAVGSCPNVDVEGYLAKELNAEAVRFLLRAAVTKNMGFVAAIWAPEVTHVFDNPTHRHLDLAEHIETLARVQ